ncbi:Uncharacterised protein [Vibrio cholerae]|nr:Uncharacterised protein [Vibrio cholerae]CSI52146.1 Uncharacterised protein [Vibrio cholerae]
MGQSRRSFDRAAPHHYAAVKCLRPSHNHPTPRT